MVPAFRAPTTDVLLRYIVRKYPSALFVRLQRKLSPHKFNNRNVWKIHIGEGTIDRAELSQTTRIEPPLNHFWADPFLIIVNRKEYMFFENYDYKTQKGKISWAQVDGTSIVETGDALDLNYHLSYPFLWQEPDNVYMVPESHAVNRVEMWRAVDFPNNWVRHATLFEGDSCAETTLFRDPSGILWCFVNKSTDKFNDHCSELYIYRIDDIKEGRITPHKKNPVIIDTRCARNAGPIYVNKDGETIRPSQINENDVYGYGLNLCRIDKLTIDEYKETIVQSLIPQFATDAIGMHHVDQVGEHFVIDVCYMKR